MFVVFLMFVCYSAAFCFYYKDWIGLEIGSVSSGIPGVSPNREKCCAWTKGVATWSQQSVWSVL